MIVSWIGNDVKWCPRCNKFQPITVFNKSSRSLDGLGSWCSICKTIEARNYRLRHVNTRTKDESRAYGKAHYLKHKDEYKKRAKQHRLDNPIDIWARNVRYNHLKRGIDVYITVDELKNLAHNTSKCCLCGNDLQFGSFNKHGKSNSNTPTLDRINNDKYINLDNCWIICYRCNMGKGDMQLNEYIDHCKNVVRIYEEGDKI